MAAIADFEDLLICFDQRNVHYLIVGGMAFIYHAKPRYTKDMDLWIEHEEDNVSAANAALSDFGSPALLDYDKPNQILQIGVAPNRINLLLTIEGTSFDKAWESRIRGKYGQADANWMDLDSLLTVKERIDSPKHQEDARTLRLLKEQRDAK